MALAGLMIREASQALTEQQRIAGFDCGNSSPEQ